MWRVGLLWVLGIALLGDAQAIVAIPPLVARPFDSDSAAPDIAPPPPPAMPRPVKPANPSDPSGNPLWGIPLNQLTNTRERPIFSQSRRPPPRLVAGAPRAEPVVGAIPKPVEHERPSLSLVGTVIADDESIGVFVDDATKEGVRLRAGEEHRGWVLRAVDRREVTLEKDQETATLVLPEPGTEAKAAPAPPPPANNSARNRRH